MAKVQDIAVTKEMLGKIFPISCPGVLNKNLLWERIRHEQTGVYEIDDGKGYVALSVFPASLHVDYAEGKGIISHRHLHLLMSFGKLHHVFCITCDVGSERLKKVLERMGFRLLWRKVHGEKLEFRLMRMIHGQVKF